MFQPNPEDTLIKQAVSADTVESRALATQAIGRLMRDAIRGPGEPGEFD